MRFTIVRELEGDAGKHRCVRRTVRRLIEGEPDDAKGRTDNGTPKNGVIKC